MLHKMRCAPALGLALVALALVPGAAQAQEVSLNYDRLSSLEEPLAFDLGDVTVSFTGLLDAPVIAEFDDLTGQDDVSVEFVGNFQVNAETQLANRWTLGVAYFGQYATDPLAGFNNTDDYADNVAGFIGTSFGTVIGGNVNQQVRELTRRARGAGNGFLAFDDFYGQLDRWGGSYLGRFGPSTIGAVVDENGDFELGSQFQRPIGERDVRFTTRYREGRFVAADGITGFETSGAGAVGEFVYGASLFDLGAGFEAADSPLTDFNRWFLSGGVRTQIGALQLSGEGHYGKADGDAEVSAALGAAYAVARGLTFNLGLNYADAQVVSDDVTVFAIDEVKGLASVRFSF